MIGTQKTMNDSKDLEECNASLNESLASGSPNHYSIPNLHPLLSVGSNKLSYDLTRPPVPNATIKHSSYSVDSTLLDQPATIPPVSSMEVVCGLLPQRIAIAPSQDSRHTYITFNDIFGAIYYALRKQVTQAEFLSSPSLQHKISNAYKRRCKQLSDYSPGHYEKERNSGLRHVDFLGEHIMFDGLTCNTDGRALWTLHVSQPNAAHFS